MATRRDKRKEPVGRVRPGDDNENTRDHERIWGLLDRLRRTGQKADTRAVTAITQVTVVSDGLAAHLADADDAHDATAVSYLGAAGLYPDPSNVELALDHLYALDGSDRSDLSVHIGGATDRHDASQISYAGGTGMSAVDVEAAIDELANEKSDATALTAHLDDTIDAHDASAISILDTAADFTAANVEDALAELQTADEADELALANHLADTTDAHDASAISILDTAADFTAANVEDALAELQTADEADELALANHLADTTDAHDASAISYAGGTGMSATDVEAAIDELATEKANATGGPAFHAKRATSNQTISPGATKVQLNDEVFDTAGAFDSTTNYRWTPGVAGYYLLSAAVHLLSLPDGKRVGALLYKNGASAFTVYLGSPATINMSSTVTGILFLSATDYVELFGYHDAATDLNVAIGDSWMAGSFLRA